MIENPKAKESGLQTISNKGPLTVLVSSPKTPLGSCAPVSQGPG